jgi:MFS family permease
VLAFLLAATLFGSALVANVDQFLLMRTAAACVMAGSMTLAYAAASKRVADERRTLAFSMIQSCMQFAFALGPMLGAACAVVAEESGDRTDYRRPFLAAAVLCAVAGIGMIVLRRRSSSSAAG